MTVCHEHICDGITDQITREQLSYSGGRETLGVESFPERCLNPALLNAKWLKHYAIKPLVKLINDYQHVLNRMTFVSLSLQYVWSNNSFCHKPASSLEAFLRN